MVVNDDVPCLDDQGVWAFFASRLAPAMGLMAYGGGLLAGRSSSLASQLPQGRSTSGRNWLAVRPSSPAGWLLQWGWGHLVEIGRLAGGHRWQAGSHRRAKARARVRAERHTTAVASNHSTGRALARLQLLILIHPPHRQAEWRRSSGGGRAAPCGEAAHIERRSSRSRPEAMPPDECRSEGTPSPSEGPYVRGERFLLTFLGACKKVSRRKGETISGRYRSNGYTQKTTQNLVDPKAAKVKIQHQAKLLLTTSNTSLDNCPEFKIRSSSPFINA